MFKLKYLKAIFQNFLQKHDSYKHEVYIVYLYITNGREKQAAQPSMKLLIEIIGPYGKLEIKQLKQALSQKRKMSNLK